MCNVTTISISIPAELADILRVKAKDNYLSLSKYITILLYASQALEDDKEE